MDPGLQAFIAYGESVPHMDYAEADYARGKLGTVFETLFGTYDLLLTPSLPMAAFPADSQVADPATQRHWIDWTPFTYPFNMTRQPAASCRGLRASLPVGPRRRAAQRRRVGHARAPTSKAIPSAFPERRGHES
jgi:aspartyl-tRNA(Asn)/glutamyl-tRNA(Gln) amidotransferase subunit A